MPKTLRQQHSEQTRKAVIRAARSLFVARGYTATMVQDIARNARVTTGAVYHHFSGKTEIMEVVLEVVEQEIVDRVTAAAEGLTDPLERFRAGNLAFLQACNETSIAAIAMREAPVALGWQRWKAIDERYSLSLVKRGFSALEQAGIVTPGCLDLLAPIYLAALMEAGLRILTSDNPTATIEAAALMLDKMALGFAR